MILMLYSLSSVFLGRSVGLRMPKRAYRGLSQFSLQQTASTLSDGPQIDTIFALSSGGGQKTGVAVIRISGPASDECLMRLLQKLDQGEREISLPKPRLASLRRIFSPGTQDLLDQALILRFPGPNSFTGEDVVELQTHGSRAVIQGVFAALEDCTSDKGRVRPAERGEFTRRAFGNGRMDLTEVEGLADLLEADTAMQRKQALRQMDGHMRVRFEHWREELIRCLAHTEAVIDFGDDAADGDIDETAMDPLRPRIEKMLREINHHLADGRKGEIVRDGIRVALVGPPNAGKSSLVNALARRPAAIVSPSAGTTRDIIELRLDLGGVPCLVSDTAGLRDESDDPIEREGIRRAREALGRADVKVFVGDASDAAAWENAVGMYREDTAREQQEDGLRIFVANKVDACEAEGRPQTPADIVNPFTISCETGEGLTEFEEALAAHIAAMLESRCDEGTLITRERHRAHMMACREHLGRFLEPTVMMDVAAEELRLAMQELGKVTGRVDVEQLLDVIFRDFCIGK